MKNEQNSDLKIEMGGDYTNKLKTRWTPDTQQELDFIESVNTYKPSNHVDNVPESANLFGYFDFDYVSSEMVKNLYPDVMTKEEKQSILKYMSSSKSLTGYMGFAMSRMEENVMLGTHDMITPDNKWVFPEKWDSHYVDKHNIAPIRKFIDDALKWNKNNV